MNMILKTVLVSLLLSFSTFAEASPRDDLDAAIQASLERKQAIAALRNIEVVYEGQLLVEDAGGYYAVTLPDITVKSGNRTVDLGIISLNAAPTEQENVWRIRLALPTPMRFTGEEGKVYASIQLPKQNIELFWHADADIYLSADADFQTVTVDDFENDMVVSFDRVSLHNAVTGLDVERITQHIEKLEEWAKNIKTNKEDATQKLDEETLESLFDLYMSDYIRSQDMKATFEGMKAEATKLDPQAEVTEKQIASAERLDFETGFIVKDNNKIDVTGQANAFGMKSSNSKDFFSLGAPDTFETSFSIVDVPEKEVTDILKEYLETLLLGIKMDETEGEKLANGEESQIKTMHQLQVSGITLSSDSPFLMSIIEAAVKAGSKIALNFSISEADQYGIMSQINIEGDNEAKHGGKGNFLMTLKGYDKIKKAALEAAQTKLDEAQQAAESANQTSEAQSTTSEEDEAYERQKSVLGNTKMVLSILEMLGKQEKMSSGAMNLVFDARVKADGTMALNGMPFQQVMSMVLPAIMMNSMGGPTTLQPAPNAQQPSIDPTLGNNSGQNNQMPQAVQPAQPMQQAQ